jgi:hypothetical protein
LKNEITKKIQDQSRNLFSDNSRNDQTFNSGLMSDNNENNEIWNNNNDQTQNSNQFKEKFQTLKKKQKETPKANIQKVCIQYVTPNNQDYSADTDEFPVASKRNEINESNLVNYPVKSMNIKNNNIYNLNKNSSIYLERQNLNTMIGQKFQSNTEPDENMIAGSYSNNNRLNMMQYYSQADTPKKMKNSVFLPQRFNMFDPNNFSNREIAPNFPIIENRLSYGSIKSTQFSSNKKNHYEINLEQNSMEEKLIFDGNSEE